MHTWQLSLFGAIGAVAPEIVLLYSKRLTMPSVHFADWQYLAVTVIYLGLAALVAAIFPYLGGKTRWKAFSVGVGLPLIVSGLATFASGHPIEPMGGANIEGDLIDLIAFR